MVQRVVIVGGGLAGLATATALAPLGFDVTILESKPRLGGRASSFRDATTDELLDNCQHVSMGCCTNFAHFCSTIGVRDLLVPQRWLYFMTPDGRVSRFGGEPWPAPFHLARSFAAAHFLTPLEKLRVGYGLARLRLPGNDDPPFLDWLLRHHQTPATIARFWGVVLVSALNEAPDRIGLRYARKVFVDGFLTHPRGFEVELPAVPLGRLYGVELQGWLDRHGASLQLSNAGKDLVCAEGRVQQIRLRDGTTIDADWFVSTVPFDRLLQLLPDDVVEANAYFRNLRQLSTSPIVSVHCWFDRPATTLPHVVLVDCVGQWLFNRGVNARDEHYVQVVVSAARDLRDAGNDEVERRVVAELQMLFPSLRSATLHRSRVITEHAATFSAVPGVDRWRPTQESPLANLLVAGDWTATGWPATMEGAVRSGYLAAEALLRKVGRPQRIVRPDLQ